MKLYRKLQGCQKKSYLWILSNGFIECETLERIADAAGCLVSDILKADSNDFTENCIEWPKDGERATLSLSQRRTISKVKKLAESHPEECQILAENKDGSIYAKVPVKWIKIQPPKSFSEEQKAMRSERMKNIRRNVQNANN